MHYFVGLTAPQQAMYVEYYRSIKEMMQRIQTARKYRVGERVVGLLAEFERILKHPAGKFSRANKIAMVEFGAILRDAESEEQDARNASQNCKRNLEDDEVEENEDTIMGNTIPGEGKIRRQKETEAGDEVREESDPDNIDPVLLVLGGESTREAA
jgi:hypothetical protein